MKLQNVTHYHSNIHIRERNEQTEKKGEIYGRPEVFRDQTHALRWNLGERGVKFTFSVYDKMNRAVIVSLN